jgi:hypothetical protein
VKNAANPQVFRDLDKHRRVIDEDGLRCLRLGEVKGKPKYPNVRLAHVNESGRDERVHKLVELERADAVRIHFTRLIADDNNLEAMPGFEFRDRLDHPWVWLRLGKHEVAKLTPRERSLLVKNYPAEVFLKGEPALFVRLEDETMSLIQVRPVEFEVLCCPLAGEMVPSIGEQYFADIHKQRLNWESPLHVSFENSISTRRA